MNKSALKKFATEARKELLERVEIQARKIGITEDSILKSTIESSDAIYIDGVQLAVVERRQRNKLIDRINEIGFKQVMEETAYTWFNRFIALRFMEVNDYLPTRTRVLSSSNPNSVEPDMFQEVLSLDLEIDKELVYKFKVNNETDMLFKYLIKLHCNDLNRYMPFMFETIEDYKEILFPEGLLGTESFVRVMTDTNVIPEEDWGKVEIVGWLYQYYILDKRDIVFDGLKSNIKVSKDYLPAATQIFTPKWVVKYMVENSLGRHWIEGNKNTKLRDKYNYYVDESTQEHEVESFIKSIEYTSLKPESIKIIDPCCGSGHILVYAFDVMYDIYAENGYSIRDIPKLIIENNLFGLDIDKRAVQLASFAIMMRARSYDRRIFRTTIRFNICNIVESNWIDNDIEEFIKSSNAGNNIEEEILYLKNTYSNALEYGSLINAENREFVFLNQFLECVKTKEVDLFSQKYHEIILEKIPLLIKQNQILSQKYDVVCTNPPYMKSSNGSDNLNDFLKKYYPISKGDLSTAFMEKTLSLCKENGLMSMINIPMWMSKSTYEKLRYQIISNYTFINMLHFGRGIFGSDFGSVAFVIRNSFIPNYISNYRQLYEKLGNVDSIKQKESWFLEGKGMYSAKQSNFLNIGSYQIAYWISKKQFEILDTVEPLNTFADPKKGLTTGDNPTFVRYWFEVPKDKFSIYLNEISKKWFPMTKGGDYRRWYGNNLYVINWADNGAELKDFRGENGKLRSVLRNTQYYLKECISWNDTTAKGKISFRYQPEGYIPNASGPCVYAENDLFYYFGLLNSVVSQNMLEILAPNMKFEVGQMNLVPIIKKDHPSIMKNVQDLVGIAKCDWDSFEVSFDFEIHPLIMHKENSGLIEDAFYNWLNFTKKQFEETKNLEEGLNKYFIHIYGLSNELDFKVANEDVTIRIADRKREVESLLSYIVGIAFKRFTIDKQFSFGEDINIIPISGASYFENNIYEIINKSVKFIFGAETLKENIDFIADSLGRRNGESSKDTIIRYFINDFYSSHRRVYLNAPIYWLFTSGKEKAFNCLIYMHSYDKTTLSRIRTDYLHPVQNRIDTEKNDLLNIINGDSTAKEISNAKKELKDLEKKIDELKAYDEKLHHMADMQIEIDLDDGVKVNYAKFEGLVAKI
ncbi:hypothetical protein ABE17_06335 [Bacillus mycoides]|uniref:BREX-1 system adenine-specific DNA-methyltransferase PglX n=1 Tax=Bacillus mycoides TaxID=1405 RepID=UPI0018CCE9CE|nr:BREX-1 system adenine-specific DNA-methyltransferase PglX [Bacillus mycoides]MBG9596518.1 hypothetical protein [Bacillus mycoides]